MARAWKVPSSLHKAGGHLARLWGSTTSTAIRSAACTASTLAGRSLPAGRPPRASLSKATGQWEQAATGRVLLRGPQAPFTFMGNCKILKIVT